MYNNFYNLRELPFSLDNDPRFFYFNEEYRQAIQFISYGIKSREGFIEIIGDVGIGKTLFCHILINQMGTNTKSIFLANAFFSELEFLEVIAYKLGIDSGGKTQTEISQAIVKHLLKEYEAGKNVVLIFDEAQNLSPNLMEQIRQFSNIGVEHSRPLQIILVGQPELENKLRHSSLRNLDQRISLRYIMKPLKKKEIKEYIYFRLKVAGYSEGINFSKGALYRIYRFSKGVPRLVNIVCDKSLLVGQFFKTQNIDGKIVAAAIKNTQSRWYHFPYLLYYNLSKSVATIMIVITLVSAVFTWKYQYKIVNWTKKISPSVSVVKTSVLRQLYLIRGHNNENENNENDQLPENIKSFANEMDGLIESLKKIDNTSVTCSAILVKMWGVNNPLDEDWQDIKRSGLNLLDVSRIAKKHGLEATQLKTDLTELQAIDLPCILDQVYDSQLPGLTPMVLAKLSPDKAVLYHPSQGIVSYAREDLRQHWSGQAIILWPNLDKLSQEPLFSQGVKQEEMYQVGIRLRQLGYIKDEKAFTDEQSLKDAICKFQQDNRLKQDGVLGTPSKIALYRILSSPFSPSLQEEG